MWLIILFLIVAVVFFGFELYRFIFDLKRRKHRKQKESSSPEVDKGKEVK